MENAEALFLEAFAELTAPRRRECEHKLEELLRVAVCAEISGAESWTSISEWGQLKLDWLRRHLPFANGIASHDPFGRVFSLLSANRFGICFMRWIRQWCPGLAGQHIAIDGKSVRRSHQGVRGPIHRVSARSATAGLTLGQIKTADKSNEITAIPELLNALDIKGAVIGIDAMGCQHNIVTRIVQGGADYVLGVKDNQPGLAEAIRLWFDSATAGSMDRPFRDDLQIETDHGRIETRRCVVTDDVGWLPQPGQHWTGLQSLVMVESTRDILHGDGTRTYSTGRRYYLSSLQAKAALPGKTVRALGH